MGTKKILCPQCGAEVFVYSNPFPTVDIIIEVQSDGGERGIVLIYRKNEPRAWALPGGFVDYGETLQNAAVREAREETGLRIEAVEQFHTYSDPQRDPRQHNISTVFIAKAKGMARAGDDAGKIGIFSEKNLPLPLAFDHEQILRDYFRWIKTGERANKKDSKSLDRKLGLLFEPFPFRLFPLSPFRPYFSFFRAS